MINPISVLLSLHIRNFALMEKVTLELGSGLNILSGETGSGKSIIVQALELLLGGRGSSDLIRHGEEEAEVFGLFQRGGEELSLRRVISRAGKNRAYLNERPVPVAALVEEGQRLLDLAGQHEHQVLLQPEKHLELLDEFAALAGEEAQGIFATYHNHFLTYTELLQKKKTLAEKVREVAQKDDFMRFQLKELDEARIQEGEEELLLREKEISKHSVKLKEISVRGDELLESGEEALTQRLSRYARDLGALTGLDPQLKEIADHLETALCSLQESAQSLRQYADGISCDPERVQEIEDRLALIGRLKKKHGGSVASLLGEQERLREQLGLLLNFDGEMAILDKQLESCERALVESASRLTECRKKSSIRLSRSIESELKDLGMKEAKFEMTVRPSEQGISVGSSHYSESGADEGEFRMAPNPGEGMHSLTRIASGGEISRVFLAIKKVLGLSKAVDTCVFDEVDVGIGGRVADVVGRNLLQLSAEKQVLCVTHLPQIACYADQHFVIQKKVSKGRTQTVVEKVQDARRETEIARMLAGVKITEQAMSHAREMMRDAARRSI